MARRTLLILAAAFLMTRLVGVWLALYPDSYAPFVAGDLAGYEQKAVAIVQDGGKPYGSVPLEYPPGSLPLLLAPELGSLHELPYARTFVAFAFLIDLAGFVALLRLATRWGSTRGAWLWIGMVVALGPIVFLRLDLLPAVATIWAVERAASAGWLGCGAWLSFGTVAKLYPAFFIPTAWWTAPRNKRLAFSIGCIWMVIPLLGLAGALDDVFRSVLGYHSTRSVQVESTWATALLIAMRRGYEGSFIALNFGAFHIEGGVAPILKSVATVGSVVGLIGATWLAIRRVERGDVERMASGFFMILAVTMATGLVLSPQFIVWLFALGAAAISTRRSLVDAAVIMLVPIAVLTQAVYPFLYDGLLSVRPLPVFVLATRNVLLITLAGAAVYRLARRDPDPSHVPTTEASPARDRPQDMPASPGAATRPAR